MNREDYINNIAHILVKDIVEGIRKGDTSLKVLQATGEFVHEKQKEVKKQLQQYKKEDDAYKNAKLASSVADYNDFLSTYPDSMHREEIQKLKEEKEVQEKRSKEELETQERLKSEQQIASIKENPNDYTIKEARDILGDDLFRQLCVDLELEYEEVVNYNPTKLNFNMIPENEDEIPENYTDVFFWGIPSSGKTTALATIFRTINDKYIMEDPSLRKQFGATYRYDLVNVYKNGLGHLPSRSQRDKTQYMPFLLRRRGEGVKKNRQISFFELSGEVFEYFLEIRDGLKAENDLDESELERRKEIEKSFDTIKLLLKSNNQKIHFFFIDYDNEVKNLKNRDGKSQVNYLTSAATYFKDHGEIFSKKTDAVYFVITKADTIEGDFKTAVAAKFLNENFGIFIEIVTDRCEEYSIKPPRTKLFSIGEVYFNRICKLEYKYAEDIVEELLKQVDSKSNSWFKDFLRR
jgi:hypothetical protein